MKSLKVILLIILVISVASCLPPPDFDDPDPIVNPLIDSIVLSVSSVFASSHDSNVPLNTLDDNLSTRWSSHGIGEWITYELNNTYEVHSINISWYYGDSRIAFFDMLYSEDGLSWAKVYSGESSGITNYSENHNLQDAAAKYIRIVGRGNNQSNWTSITTVTILGKNVDENTLFLDYPEESDPTPVQNPSGGGLADVPLTPSDLRIVVVAQDGSGQYLKIQEALDAALPGDTIKVKAGVYVEALRLHKHGTRENPIALVAYPGHKPVISPGNDAYPFDSSRMVRLDASWIIIDGFEFRYGRDGIRVNRDHNTIRNNWIHHNQYIGIMNANYGVNNLLIENNLFEYNGHEACWHEGVLSPRHCHQLYFSKGQNCDVSMTNITVRNNSFRQSTGAGIQWNGQNCLAGFEQFLVENNQFTDSARAFTLYHNVRNTTIRNNDIIFNNHPATNAIPKTIILLWGNSTGNVFENNSFQSSLSDMLAIHVSANSGIYALQNNFNRNTWNITSNRWGWEGVTRSDLRESFRSVTGWEEHGTIR